MMIDAEVEAGWPPTCDWPALAEQAAAAAGAVAAELGNPRLTVSVLFTSDDEVRSLNAQWRGKDRPTNVLSFPMLAREELLALAADGPPELLGDIALAAETCAREAADKGVTVADHAAHLIVHGLLHLAGHDHEADPAEAEAMEAKERKALASLGIADPYADDNEAVRISDDHARTGPTSRRQ